MPIPSIRLSPFLWTVLGYSCSRGYLRVQRGGAAASVRLTPTGAITRCKNRGKGTRGAVAELILIPETGCLRPRPQDQPAPPRSIQVHATISTRGSDLTSMVSADCTSWVGERRRGPAVANFVNPSIFEESHTCAGDDLGSMDEGVGLTGCRWARGEWFRRSQHPRGSCRAAAVWTWRFPAELRSDWVYWWSANPRGGTVA